MKEEDIFNTMSLNAEKGHKVKVTDTTIDNGYDLDIEQAKKFLSVGQTYTIESIRVEDWNTTVVLQEFPNETFNSVNFIDVQKSEYDKRYKRYLLNLKELKIIVKK